jgi:uncharacterized membrane protein YdbT with pleckstrin-like domain
VGKPWIFPSVLVRTVLIIAVGVVILWLEFTFNAVYQPVFGIPVILWTFFVLLVLWFISVLGLLLLRASNTYVLRKGSLEMKSGIITTRSFVVTPEGFGSMEVIRSLVGRIINMGNIMIRTQDPNDRDKRLPMIRDPEKIAAQIRNVMSAPVFRMDR